MTWADRVVEGKSYDFSKIYCYEYPRPSITVDLVIISHLGRDAKVLLVERRDDPFKGKLALPGGYMNLDESLVDAALRELKEETGLVFNSRDMNFVDFYDKPDRDPRGRVVSFAFLAMAAGTPKPTAGDDAATADWYPVSTRGLAFDHDLILSQGTWKAGFSPSGDWP